MKKFRISYSILIVVVLMGLVFNAGRAEAGMKGSRPNVIFFLGDDQSRFDHAAYGNEKVPTPTTDAFAKESLVFERAFTGQAICAPSRSMLYTGMYPVKNGCFLNHYKIRKGIKTLPQHLEKMGYTVILAGKSHVQPKEQFAWTKHFRSVKKEGMPRAWIPIEEIDEFLAKPGSTPFCIIVASEYPHPPYFKETPYKPEDVTAPPFLLSNPDNLKGVARDYRSIQEKEAEFAALLEVIEKHGMKDNSIVFYADDHGLHRGKFTTYDAGLNVAFMVRWPEKIKQGRTDSLISFADFVPTMIELAGGTPPNNLDGQSLLPVLENGGGKHHDYVYGVVVSQGIKARHIFPQRSVHDGRYHYIHSFNTMERAGQKPDTDPSIDYFLKRGASEHPDVPQEMLFDTETDPHEMTNLAQNPEMEEVKERLQSELFHWMEVQNDYLTKDGSVPILEVKKKYSLDQMDLSYFTYEIPEEKVGSLKGKAIDPHGATSPKEN